MTGGTYRKPAPITGGAVWQNLFRNQSAAEEPRHKWQEASELQARVGYGSTDVAIVAAAR
jgi:hypothetical protein